MCGVCGILGDDGHWTDAAPSAAPGAGATRRARRLNRVRLANAVLAPVALGLADWQGAKFLLSSRTGRTELVDNLAEIWQAAERILGRPLDPLDPGLIARLEEAAEP
jgi:hypothetical protein